MILGAAVVLTAVLAPGAAQAAPPSNDDFAGATAITSLPYSSTADTSDGTAADDDPFTCSWSTSSVFEQTLERAKESRVTIDLLPTWYDVDDQTTLRRLCEELLGDTMVSAGYAAPETHAFIANLIAREGRERIWPNN